MNKNENPTSAEIADFVALLALVPAGERPDVLASLQGIARPPPQLSGQNDALPGE